MDFFKGIGDFFGGLFGKKKKQNEVDNWNPQPTRLNSQPNALSSQTDLGSTKFNPSTNFETKPDYSFKTTALTPSTKPFDDTTDFSKDNTSGLNLSLNNRNKLNGNKFTLGGSSRIENTAVHEDDINSTIKQLNDRYHDERNSFGRFWDSFTGDTDRRDKELRRKIITDEMKKITNGLGSNPDGTYKRDFNDDEAYKMATLQLALRHGVDGQPLKAFVPNTKMQSNEKVGNLNLGDWGLATARTIKNMTDGEDGLGGLVGNALLGKRKADEGFNLGRFVADLPSGMISGMAETGADISDVLSGKRMLDDGSIQNLNGLQRFGSGLNAALNVGDLQIGGSGTLFRSIFKNGIKQAAKEAGKAGLKETAKRIAKDLAKDAAKEGLEEGIQQIAQNLSNTDNYDANGNFKTEKLLDQVGESTALGALGGGIMSGAGLGINFGKAKLGELSQNIRQNIDQRINPQTNPVQNAVAKVEAQNEIKYKISKDNSGSNANNLYDTYTKQKTPTDSIPPVNFVEENGMPIYRGQQSEERGIYYNDTNFTKRADDPGYFFTPDKEIAKKYGNNILETKSNKANTVSAKEANELVRWAGEKVNEDIKAQVETNELIEQMALGRSGAIAEYTGKPFVETGDGFGEKGELQYYKAVDDAAGKIRFKKSEETNTTRNFQEQSLRKIIGNEYDIISKTSDNTPRTAQGYADLKNGIVSILDGKMSTANHEATHIAINALADTNPRLANSAINNIIDSYGADALISEANKSGYGDILGHKLDATNIDDVRYAAEERLANDFAKYAEAKAKGRENYYAKKNSIPAQIKAWFDYVIDHLKDMAARLDSAHNFMYKLERGDFANMIDNHVNSMRGTDIDVLTTQPQMAYRIDPETNIVHIDNDANINHGMRVGDIGREIRKQIGRMIGLEHELGTSGITSKITSDTKNEVSNKQDGMSYDDFVKKGRIAGNLDELVRTMRDVDVEEMKPGKAKQTGKKRRDADYYIKGTSTFNLDGKLYDVRVIAEVNKKGDVIDYDLSYIKEKTTGGQSRLISPDGLDQSSYNSILSQSGDNIKMKLDKNTAIEPVTLNQNNSLETNANLTDIEHIETPRQNQPKNKAKNDDNPTRKFIETVLENAPPKDFRQAVEESNGKGKYKVRNTESLWKQAVEEVAKDPLGSFKDIEDARSDKAIAKGIALAEYFKAQGDNASSSAVYIKLAEKATEAGRRVQALSLIKKATPEGMLMNISRQIDAYNNLQDKRGRFAKDKIILDDQTRAYWYQRLQEIYEMPAKTKEQERTKKIAMGQFNKEVSKIFPSKKWDKTMAIWKAGLLSAPTTHIRNIVGNTANLIGEAASNIVSVPTDLIASKFTGIRSTTLKGTKGYGRGLAEGWKTAKDIMHTGVDTSGDVIAKYDSKDVHFDSKLGKGIQAYTDTIFRALNAADKPFKQGMFESSIDSQAYAMAKNKGLKGKEAKAYAEKLIKNPTAEMQEAATVDAEMATFQQSTAMGNAIRGAKNKGGTAGKALDVVTPFTQVPSAVADQAVNYSPFGLIKAVKEFGDVKKAINAGLSEAQIMQLQRKAVKQTGRFITGTALIGAGVILAKNGMLSGAAKDDKERRQWQAEGKMENAVKIGNNWFSLDSIAPELLILNAGGQLSKDLRNSNDIGTTLAKSGLNVAKQFTEQSYMTGLKSGLDAVTDPERSAGKLFGSLATSVIPNAVKKGAQSLDDKQRQVNSLEDSLKASIPGLRNTLPQKYDIYGKPMQNDMGFLENLFSPVRRTSIKENNLTNSIDALREKDSDYDKIIPNRPPKTVKIGDGNHTLTAEESSEYQRLMGELTSRYMQEQGFNNESFKKLSDDDKVKILTNIKTDVKSAVENHLFNNKNSEKMSDNKKVISHSLSGGQTADPVWQTKEEKKEDLYTRKEAEYEKFKKEYEEKSAKGEYSRKSRIEAQNKLRKLEVGKDFSKETRDLYSLGKDDFRNLIESSEDGNKVLDNVLAYGDALVKAGIISRNKFRDRSGNISLSDTSIRGRGGGSRNGGSTPSYKIDTMSLIRGALKSSSSSKASVSFNRKAATKANTQAIKRLNSSKNKR